ncbi:MAG: DUF427 domain-containing protein [Euzebya sp.]
MSASNRPAAEGLPTGHYPPSPVAAGHTAPVPRRIRAIYDGATVVDTTRATYVWEHPYYPQYFIPEADVDASVLHDDGTIADSDRGQVRLRSLHHGQRDDEHSAQYLATSTIEGLAATYRFDWEVMDAWYEEDEQVFVHPRSPYVRVDALRSSRLVRVEIDGVVLAQSAAPVAVCETGLPTRWYLDPTAVDFQHLVTSSTQTRCPYKGTTSQYWTVRIGSNSYEDLAWNYDFPTRQLSPIAGLICFYNEKVDLFVDGVPQS